MRLIEFKNEKKKMKVFMDVLQEVFPDTEEPEGILQIGEVTVEVCAEQILIMTGCKHEWFTERPLVEDGMKNILHKCEKCGAIKYF